MKELQHAFEFAAKHHHGQEKKATGIPFVYHPMAVAALVLRYGGSPVQAQAALLHDTIADDRVTERELADRFGEEVARLVFAFADPERHAGSPEPSWQDSRRAYLAKLAGLDPEALFVVACEELHDGSELLHDLRYQGAEVWKRYPAHGMELFWYFRELLQIFHRKLSDNSALVGEFGRLVAALKAITIEGATY